MKLLFSADWLRRKIASGPDVELQAGRFVPDLSKSDEIKQGKVAVMVPRNSVQLRIGFGTLVRQLRYRDGLSLQELAFQADVPEEELRQVETNPSYTARPRMIHNLSQHFGVSLRNLSQMSGSTAAVDRRLYNDVVAYAAHSDAAAPLSEEQRQVLNAFVATLNASTPKT